jgi:uncharacterized RDD family membrane protein YckC
MRCTKCHYLSFEPEPRCRNCGHDLSLEEGAAFDLNESELEGSREYAAAGARSGKSSTAVLSAPRAAAATNRIPTSELPLFVQSVPGVSDRLAHDDEPEDLEPLVKVPARPRTPVSVRRATPDPAKLRAKYGLSPSPEPDLWSNLPPDPIDSVKLHDDASAFQDLPLTADNDQWANGPAQQWRSEPQELEPRDFSPEYPGQEWSNDGRAPVGWQEGEAVGAGTRLISAAIDGTLLGGILVATLYLTLSVTGLTFAQIGVLPILPFVGLFMMVAVGYELIFTAASGQTIGKMAMNIKVVGTTPEAVFNDRVPVSQAAVRALMALPSALLLGLGFAPIIGSGSAVHDRIAHTRVVRR